MRNKILFFLLCISFNLSGQTTRTDSVIVHDCLFMEDHWDSAYQTTIDSISYTYDSDGRLIKKSIITYSGSTITNFEVDSIVYDTLTNTVTTINGSYTKIVEYDSLQRINTVSTFYNSN